jgi:hypothetical protein
VFDSTPAQYWNSTGVLLKKEKQGAVGQGATFRTEQSVRFRVHPWLAFSKLAPAVVPR